MTSELLVLGLAALLQAVQFAIYAVRANLELGTDKTLGPRDEDISQGLSTRTARLKRAADNHLEALPLFTIAVVLVSFTEVGNGFTALCAWSYLVARILYVPAYALGLSPWRSVIWAVGFLATMLMILMALVL
ncbi:MAPEG family protein [Amaricoccus macauensis]|uniref:MAPEG family protein n=1 Tax=Amaricoccus macauensis TaxID=57001 RepID=UPI003C7DFF09